MTTLATQGEPEGYQRLHITPLRPELLNTYLGSSLTPLVKNISYHTVQTYPEKGFGYVDLPVMEAAKLKKKLNGSILKGQKIRIEDAKPEKRKRSSGGEDGDADATEKAHKKTRRLKKSKDTDKVLQGYELEGGRKVKRGWTETPAEKRADKEKQKKKSSKDKSEKTEKKDKKDKKKREASKYTTEPECLFRTSLPTATSSQSGDKSEKKSKKEKKKQKGEAVVHEFSNTKKHALFLKSASTATDGKATREYVDGKGWVDAEGNVLEDETEKQREKRERRERKEHKRAEKQAQDEAHELEVPTIRDEPLSSRTSKKLKAKWVVPVDEGADKDDAPSSSEPSSIEDSSEEEEDDDEDEEETTPAAAEASKEIHPLEALYKRPKLSSLDTTPQTPKEAAFSFFGGENDSDIDEADERITKNEPQTPFTERDMEWRGTRSAAPTPDTAAIGRPFSFSVLDQLDEDEDEDEDEKETADSTTAAINGLGITNGAGPVNTGRRADGEKEESEFAKWFFENRSENNKKWRTRRRDAMKMKRKRENRRLTRRII